MKKNSIVKAFLFINFYSHGIIQRIFGVDKNRFTEIINKFEKFKDKFNKDKGNKLDKNSTNFSKIYYEICNQQDKKTQNDLLKIFTYATRYVINNIKHNKDTFSEDKIKDFETLVDQLSDINKISQISNQQFSYQFIYNLILFWRNELDNPQIRTNTKHLQDREIKDIIKKHGYEFTKSISMILIKQESNIENEMLFCYSFFFPKSLLNEMLNEICKNSQASLLNIKPALAYQNFKINMDWNEDNDVCKNLKNTILCDINNYLRLLNVNQKNYVLSRNGIWNNIFKVLYFHSYKFNQSKKADAKKVNIIYPYIDKFCIRSVKHIFSNNKIYNHLPKNCLIVLKDYFLNKEKIWINETDNYKLNDNSTKTDSVKLYDNLTITRQNVMNFYYNPNEEKNIFNYDHFEEFIVSELQKNLKKKNEAKANKQSLSKQTEKQKELDNKIDWKELMKKRIIGNYMKMGEKLFILKHLKYFVYKKDDLNNNSNQSLHKQQISHNKNFVWKHEIKEFMQDHNNKKVDHSLTQQLINKLAETISTPELKTKFQQKYANCTNFLNSLELIKKDESYFRSPELKQTAINAKRIDHITKSDFRDWLFCPTTKEILENFKKKYLIKTEYENLFNDFKIDDFVLKTINIMVDQKNKKNQNEDKNDNNKYLTFRKNDIMDFSSNKAIKTNKIFFEYLIKQNKPLDKNHKQKHDNFFDLEILYLINQHNLKRSDFWDKLTELRALLFDTTNKVEELSNKEKNIRKNIIDKLDHITQQGHEVAMEVKAKIVEIVCLFKEIKTNHPNEENIELLKLLLSEIKNKYRYIITYIHNEKNMNFGVLVPSIITLGQNCSDYLLEMKWVFEPSIITLDQN